MRSTWWLSWHLYQGLSREKGAGEAQVWGHMLLCSPDRSRDLNHPPDPLYRHMSCCSWECNQTLGHLEQRSSITQHGQRQEVKSYRWSKSFHLRYLTWHDLINKSTTKWFTWKYRDDRKGSLSIVNIEHILDPVSRITVFCIFPTQQW